MNKYRIKKGTYADFVRYYPQKRILWWWENICFSSLDGGYSTLEKAQEAICSHIRKKPVPEPVMEYIYFDHEEVCK